MSTTEGRRDRIKRLMDLMIKVKRPLTPNEIAAKTGILEEITKERLYIYLENLVWSGQLNQQGNTYKAIIMASSNSRVRERERERKKERK